MSADELEIERTAARLGIGFAPSEMQRVAPQVRDMLRRALEFDHRRSDDGAEVVQRADRPFDPEPADPHRAFITTCRIEGEHGGPLAGVRVSLKDHIAVAGLPLTLGSAMLRDHIATQDATVVTRLLAAGATIVGKNNLSAFSLTDPGFLGKPINPAFPDREPGGSSSGSAVAVAAGLTDVAIGGDQGGSVRIPASWCDVVGCKPTYGRVPHTGVVSGNDPLLDHIGPIARSVRDVARTLACISGRDGRDLRQLGVPRADDPQRYLDRGVQGIRIGVLAEGFGGAIDPAVDAAARDAIDRLDRAGATITTVSVPDHLTVQGPYFCCVLEGSFHAWQANLANDPVRGELPESVIEAFARIGWADDARASPLVYRTNVLAGALLFERHGGVVLARAHNARAHYAAQYDRCLAEVDALVMPTIPIPPPLLDGPPLDAASHDVDPLLRVRNTLPFDYTGHPALTVPCGAVGSLPVGLQLVGAPFDEATLLQIGAVVEAGRVRKA